MNIVIHNNEFVNIFLGQTYGSASVEYGRILTTNDYGPTQIINGKFQHESLVNLLINFGFNLNDYEEDVIEYLNANKRYIRIEKDGYGNSNYSICDCETNQIIYFSPYFMEMMIKKVLPKIEYSNDNKLLGI